jgi:hypothetical protein
MTRGDNLSWSHIFIPQTSRFHYGSKVPAVTYNSIYNNTETNRLNSCQSSTKFSEEGGTSIVNHLYQQPWVTWSILTTKVNVKNTFTSHNDKKYFWHICWLPYLYTFSLYENPSFIIVSADGIYFDKILVSEYKLFKRSNKANLFRNEMSKYLDLLAWEMEYISTRSWYPNINFLRDRIRRIFFEMKCLNIWTY